ncbi:lysine -specific demethylase 4c-like protein, partial [Colletotrichum sojae]
MAIGSRPAIQQFCNIVRSRRDPNDDRSRVASSSDPNIRIEQRINNIRKSQQRSDLEKLRKRLDEFYLAEDIEQSKDGRLQSDPTVIGNILKRTGLSKDTFKHHQKWGNKWRVICRGRPALMCFIPLGQNEFDISSKTYTELESTELDRFHHLIDIPYVHSICTAAEAFLRSLDSTSDDVEFRWEADNMPLHELPENKMLDYLQPFPSSPGNMFHPNDHDLFDAWPNVPWPFDTPQPPDPTMIAKSVYPKCDFCDIDDCQCVLGSDRGGHHQPRIKDYGGLGRGLQAVALKMGQVAYEKGAVIGFVTGEVVPAGARSGPWALDFVRPDLDGEPI